jgi:hypothetical protein
MAELWQSRNVTVILFQNDSAFKRNKEVVECVRWWHIGYEVTSDSC